MLLRLGHLAVKSKIGPKFKEHPPLRADLKATPAREDLETSTEKAYLLGNQ